MLKLIKKVLTKGEKLNIVLAKKLKEKKSKKNISKQMMKLLVKLSSKEIKDKNDEVY